VTHTKTLRAIENTPLCTRIWPCSLFVATPPGAAPGPPVKTGARVLKEHTAYKRGKLGRMGTLGQGPVMGRNDRDEEEGTISVEFGDEKSREVIGSEDPTAMCLLRVLAVLCCGWFSLSTLTFFPESYKFHLRRKSPMGSFKGRSLCLWALFPVT